MHPIQLMNQLGYLMQYLIKVPDPLNVNNIFITQRNLTMVPVLSTILIEVG
ncbi:unnamed protein product [Callosobruchus maculatus]|uniref:Uncharacterized protein n=1 Tax=Callosobruchus maculatus TaxID=64391 RepID=A0A653DR49_CALMS|nr:unnamed protein product [Callosobruchus maculatus]